MRTFAFLPTQSINKLYGWILNRYRRSDLVIDIVKVSFLIFVFIVFAFVYLYFVNLASTRWYFLRQENQKLNTISFQFEILKTKMLDYKQQNREAINSMSFKRDVVDVHAEIVKIPTEIKLSLR